MNIYAFGLFSQQLSGNHENTDIGRFIATFLDLDLNLATSTLRNWKNKMNETQPSFDVKATFHRQHFHSTKDK